MINQQFLNAIKHSLKGCGPIMVHSDIMKAMSAIQIISDKQILLERHISALDYIANGRDILFPSFNYDFTKVKTFNVDQDPSQIGVLSEFARKNWAEWRSEMPIFNVCGQGKNPVPPIKHASTIDPFAKDSVFGHIVKHNGSILFYGAPISAMTFIHYIERASGGPVYRYDKIFSGQVLLHNQLLKDVSILYHVRPMGMHLNYDWQRLYNDLIDSKIIETFSKGSSFVHLINAKKIFDFWCRKISRNPLYLLDQKSVNWVKPKIDMLNRRFQQSDFEEILV